MTGTVSKPTFKQAFLFWLKLGFISFGGPAGQIAIMHEFLVDKQKWISDQKFLHALNYCMLLPGPEAQQLAIYIGWLLHGTLGGLVAGLLFVLPSMFILLALSMAYVTIGSLPWVSALFMGLKPAVIAIVVLALIKIGKKSLLSPFHYIVALLAFICIFFFQIPFPYIILGAIVLGVATLKVLPQLHKASPKQAADQAADERAYYLNTQSVIPNTGFSALRLVRQVLTAVFLWVLPVALFHWLSADFDFWYTLSLFFTKAAFVTFGGAYAVLPYVAQYSVETLHWLSKLQMIDGLALGETTPGPLIMILTFVGFMAGYNHTGFSLWHGALGLVTTTYFTFLPCFLFIFAGAPLIERTQANKHVKDVLALVTAAVVGVVLNLTLYLAQAVLFPEKFNIQAIDYLALVWAVLSFMAMYRFKISMIIWIAISALFGWLRFWFGI